MTTRSDVRYALVSYPVMRLGLWRLIPARHRRKVLPSRHIARFVLGRFIEPDESPNDGWGLGV